MYQIILLNYRTVFKMYGSGELRRCGESLRVGRSGDWIPVGARFSAPVQTGRGAHPASYTIRTGSFPGVKRPGRGVDHPPTSSAEVKERVELHLYSPSGPSWPVLGRPLPLPLPYSRCEMGVSKTPYYEHVVTTSNSMIISISC